MRKNTVLILFFFNCLAILNSCNEKERLVAPTIDNEGLTTVSIVVTNIANPLKKDTATWEQLLDNNGNAMSIDTNAILLNLDSSSAYTAELLLWDKSQLPAFNVSEEIRERANYHLFFYQPLPSIKTFVIPYIAGDILPSPIPTNTITTTTVNVNPLNLVVVVTDTDNNSPGFPLGLKTSLFTGSPGNGWLRLQLRHQPTGKDGSYLPGSTDLDIGFKINIK